MFLDSSGFISMGRFREIVWEESDVRNVNPKKVHKVSSQQNKCIQLVDFIAGAARAESEHSDDTLRILNEKISFACRH